MAYADRYSGTDLVVEFLEEGGSTVTVLTGDYTEFTMSRSRDTIDVTAGSELQRVFIPSLESMDWTLSIYKGDESILEVLNDNAKGRVDVYPTGKTSGHPFVSFNAVITGIDDTSPFDGAVEIEVSGVRNGAMISDYGDTYTP